VQEEILISAQCIEVVKSVRNLASEKSKDGKYDPSLAMKPKRSVYIHTFDALTYPIMFYDVRPTVPQVSVGTSSVVEINA